MDDRSQLLGLWVMSSATVMPAGYVAYQVASQTARVVASSRLEWKSMQVGGTSTYQGGNYCGPGWGFTKADAAGGKLLPEAIDAIDAACRHHDQCYADHGYFTASCNVHLATDLTRVILANDSTEQQRFDAAVMAAIFATEVATVDWWLKPANELRQELDRMYRELLSTGAQFLYVIEQGIWRSAQFPGGGGGSF